MHNKKGTKIIITIIVFIISIAVANQAKSIFLADEKEETIFEQTKRELDSSKAYNEELQKIANELKSEYEARINALGDNELETKVKEMYAQLNMANLIAGLTEVTGNGVIFSLNDRSKDDVDLWETDQSKLIVHSRQVYTVINELIKAGAQAISINDERIISTSEIFCTGGNIKINGKMYVPPYVITAIGDQERLYKSVMSSDIYKEVKIERRLRVSFSREINLIIPKYKGSVDKKINEMKEIKEEININD